MAFTVHLIQHKYAAAELLNELEEGKVPKGAKIYEVSESLSKVGLPRRGAAIQVVVAPPGLSGDRQVHVLNQLISPGLSLDEQAGAFKALEERLGRDHLVRVPGGKSVPARVRNPFFRSPLEGLPPPPPAPPAKATPDPNKKTLKLGDASAEVDVTNTKKKPTEFWEEVAEARETGRTLTPDEKARRKALLERLKAEQSLEMAAGRTVSSVGEEATEALAKNSPKRLEQKIKRIRRVLDVYGYGHEPSLPPSAPVESRYIEIRHLARDAIDNAPAGRATMLELHANRTRSIREAGRARRTMGQLASMGGLESLDTRDLSNSLTRLVLKIRAEQAAKLAQIDVPVGGTKPEFAGRKAEVPSVVPSTLKGALPEEAMVLEEFAGRKKPIIYLPAIKKRFRDTSVLMDNPVLRAVSNIEKRVDGGKFTVGVRPLETVPRVWKSKTTGKVHIALPIWTPENRRYVTNALDRLQNQGVLPKLPEVGLGERRAKGIGPFGPTQHAKYARDLTERARRARLFSLLVREQRTSPVVWNAFNRRQTEIEARFMAEVTLEVARQLQQGTRILYWDAAELLIERAEKSGDWGPIGLESIRKEMQGRARSELSRGEVVRTGAQRQELPKSIRRVLMQGVKSWDPVSKKLVKTTQQSARAAGVARKKGLLAKADPKTVDQLVSDILGAGTQQRARILKRLARPGIGMPIAAAMIIPALALGLSDE